MRLVLGILGYGILAYFSRGYWDICVFIWDMGYLENLGYGMIVRLSLMRKTIIIS